MFNFTPGTIPSNVFVIGGGGTGSRLIPLLSQFMRSITRGVSPSGWLEKPRIWLIDDDVVEQKNILRQNFIDRDVGQHKAVVLANRYSKAYNVDIIPITQRITTSSAQGFRKLVDDNLFIANGNSNHATFNSIIGSSIVIICVDSVQARRDILNTFIFKERNSQHGELRTFFVDAGNEDNFGQVNMFTPHIVNAYTPTSEEDKNLLPKMVPVAANIDYVPMNAEYYRNLVDTPAQGSCADLNQTLAINAIMATTIMGIVQNYFYRKPMNYNCVSISLNGGNSTTYNTYNMFNNMGIAQKDQPSYIRGNISTREKDGSSTSLAFGQHVVYHDANTLRMILVEKIADIQREIEKAARIAREAEEKRIEDARVKVVADRKRAEIRALVEKQRAIAAGTWVEPGAEVSAAVAPEVLEPVASPRGRRAAIAAIDAAVASAPPLVATPRAPRAMATLEVPSAWNPEVVEDSRDVGFVEVHEEE